MQFVEIAPDYYLNTLQVVQFRLVYAPERGGYCWVFTLTGGKNIFSIPFKSKEEARRWLGENFERLTILAEEVRNAHDGYNPSR